MATRNLKEIRTFFGKLLFSLSKQVVKQIILPYQGTSKLIVNPIHIVIRLPESGDLITVDTSHRVTARMITNYLIEKGLLNSQLRYTCHLVDRAGRTLDPYTALRYHPIKNGATLNMRIRKRSVV